MLTLSLPTFVAPNLRLWETAGWNTSCEATDAIAKLVISRKRRYLENIMRLYPRMNIIYRHPLTRDFIEDFVPVLHEWNNIAVIFDRISVGLLTRLLRTLGTRLY
jgi:hypothetical protein